jgi:hypothetical protein
VEQHEGEKEMKMDMSAKPTGDDMPESNEGTYDQEHLACMLEQYVAAKKIEADPALFATLKDYAMSKNKMVEELFKDGPNKPVKSLKDIKSRYDEKVAPKSKSASISEMEDSDEEA